MFTGLVEAMGVVAARTARGPGFRLSVRSDFSSLTLGESIAVSGVCLTVSSLNAHGFEADVTQETYEKTTLGRVELGSAVNLERSLALGSRLGGHWVVGHVDGVARIERVSSVGEARCVSVRAPQELSRFLASKGSVCLDGVSLTVNSVQAPVFEVMLIPETLARTTLSGWAPGTDVNLEVDLMARYVVHALDVMHSESRDASLLRTLGDSGFLQSSR
jgi:riboflavin synthase